jgi:hypothetical protein
MSAAEALARLRAALSVWEKSPRPNRGHVEQATMFALATIAFELREVRLTLQAQHEEAMKRPEG